MIYITLLIHIIQYIYYNLINLTISDTYLYLNFSYNNLLKRSTRINYISKSLRSLYNRELILYLFTISIYTPNLGNNNEESNLLGSIRFNINSNIIDEFAPDNYQSMILKMFEEKVVPAIIIFSLTVVFKLVVEANHTNHEDLLNNHTLIVNFEVEEINNFSMNLFVHIIIED